MPPKTPLVKSRLPVVLLVSGDREWQDKHSIKDRIEALQPELVIQGGARGADHLTYQACIELEIACLTVPAKWSTHHRAAGPIRNSKMLEYLFNISHGLFPDCEIVYQVYIFHPDLSKSKGTKDLATKAEGYPWIKVEYFTK